MILVDDCNILPLRNPVGNFHYFSKYEDDESEETVPRQTRKQKVPLLFFRLWRKKILTRDAWSLMVAQNSQIKKEKLI